MSDRLREEIDEGLQFYLGKDYEWYKKHRDIDDWIFELVSTQVAAEVDKARREELEILKGKSVQLKDEVTGLRVQAVTVDGHIKTRLAHLNTQESEERDE